MISLDPSGGPTQTTVALQPQRPGGQPNFVAKLRWWIGEINANDSANVAIWEGLRRLEAALATDEAALATDEPHPRVRNPTRSVATPFTRAELLRVLGQDLPGTTTGETWVVYTSAPQNY